MHAGINLSIIYNLNLTILALHIIKLLIVLIQFKYYLHISNMYLIRHQDSTIEGVTNYTNLSILIEQSTYFGIVITIKFLTFCNLLSYSLCYAAVFDQTKRYCMLC